MEPDTNDRETLSGSKLRLAHISDIHVHDTRRAEYKTVFNRLLDDLRVCHTEDPLDGIVVTGDTYDTMNKASAENWADVAWMFDSLAGIAPLIVIPGNHDLNVRAPGSPDLIGPMLKAAGGARDLQVPRVTYWRHSGIYEYLGALWFVGAPDEPLPDPELLRERLASDARSELADSNATDTPIVALFHENLESARLPNGERSRATRFTMRYLERLRAAAGGNPTAVLLGDIHARQQIRLDPPSDGRFDAWYAGSLVAQNFGEGHLGHGWLEWAIARNAQDAVHQRVVVHQHDVPNPHAFITFELKNGEDVTPTPLPETPQAIRLIYDAESRDYREFAKNLEERYRMPLRDIRCTTAMSEALALPAPSAGGSPDAGPAPSTPHGGPPHVPSADIIRDLLKGDDKFVDAVVARFNEAARENNEASARIVLRRLEFSNLFCYGPDNVIDFAKFSSDPGLGGLVSPNRTGKSSIFDILAFAMYDVVPRGSKVDIVNVGARSYSLRLEFEVDGRRGVLLKSGKGGVAHAGTKIQLYLEEQRVGTAGEDAQGTDAQGEDAQGEAAQGEDTQGTEAQGNVAIARQFRELTGKSITETVERMRGIFGLFEDASSVSFARPAEVSGVKPFALQSAADRRKFLSRILRLGTYDSAKKQADREATNLRAVIKTLWSQVKSISEIREEFGSRTGFTKDIPPRELIAEVSASKYWGVEDDSELPDVEVLRAKRAEQMGIVQRLRSELDSVKRELSEASPSDVPSGVSESETGVPVSDPVALRKRAEELRVEPLGSEQSSLEELSENARSAYQEATLRVREAERVELERDRRARATEDRRARLSEELAACEKKILDFAAQHSAILKLDHDPADPESQITLLRAQAEQIRAIKERFKDEFDAREAATVALKLENAQMELAKLGETLIGNDELPDVALPNAALPDVALPDVAQSTDSLRAALEKIELRRSQLTKGIGGLNSMIAHLRNNAKGVDFSLITDKVREFINGSTWPNYDDLERRTNPNTPANIPEDADKRVELLGRLFGGEGKSWVDFIEPICETAADIDEHISRNVAEEIESALKGDPDNPVPPVVSGKVSAVIQRVINGKTRRRLLLALQIIRDDVYAMRSAIRIHDEDGPKLTEFQNELETLNVEYARTRALLIDQYRLTIAQLEKRRDELAEAETRSKRVDLIERAASLFAEKSNLSSLLGSLGGAVHETEASENITALTERCAKLGRLVTDIAAAAKSARLAGLKEAQERLKKELAEAEPLLADMTAEEESAMKREAEAKQMRDRAAYRERVFDGEKGLTASFDEYEIVEGLRSVLDPKKGVATVMLEKSREAFAERINEALAESDANFRVVLTPDFELRLRDLGVALTRELAAELGSGYQLFALDVAVRVALLRVARVSLPSCLLIDEGFGCLDSDNLPKIGASLANAAKTLLVLAVTHHENLRKFFRHVLEIEVGRNTPDSAPLSRIVWGSAEGQSAAGDGVPQAGVAQAVRGAVNPAPGAPPPQLSSARVLCEVCEKEFAPTQIGRHRASAGHKKLELQRAICDKAVAKGAAKVIPPSGAGTTYRLHCVYCEKTVSATTWKKHKTSRDHLKNTQY